MSYLDFDENGPCGSENCSCKDDPDRAPHDEILAKHFKQVSKSFSHPIPSGSNPLSVQDIVNDPQHYTLGVEVLQFCDSWDMNFSCGNAVKYITRSPHKGKPVEDLAKALFYVAFELEKQGGSESITKFAERWLKQKTMLTKKYILEES